jgi:RND family efflux transporter MFP subunit
MAIAVLPLFLVACGSDIEPGRTEAGGESIKGLVLAKVTASNQAGGESYVGTVESSDRGTLAARIDGRVSRMLVAEGARVEAGQVLLEITDNPASDRLKESEAALAEARGAAAAAGARQVLAAKTHERFQRLFSREAVTPQEFDQVSAELEMANQGLAGAKAGVRRAEAAVAVASTAFDHTRITAPYAGVVAGRMVQEGSTVLPGAPLLVLDRVGPSLVRADLPLALTGRIAIGDSFLVEIPALQKQLAGTVREVISAADPASRSFQVKVELTTDESLVPGLFARVRPAGGGEPALLVPASAIVTRGQLTAVYVVANQTLHYRLVKIGRRIGSQVEILSGLAGGESLVVEGVQRARNGARVEGSE